LGKGKLVVLLILVIIAGLGVYIYKASTTCKASIESCCLTTQYIRIKVKGGCDGMTARIIDRTGNIVGEVNVRPGDNLLKIELPTEGKYRVELRYHGFTLDKVEVETTGIPAVVSAKAVLLPNGMLTIDVHSTGAHTCLVDNFSIKKIILVIVFKNGTIKNITFTGPYPVEGKIELKTDVNMNMWSNIESVYTLLIDSLDRQIQAFTQIPR
jgi:hypothetical protein